MRLFIAVELPAAARDAAAVASAGRDAWPPARWVRAGHLHLTLAFLGEVEESGIPNLEAALRRRLAPFTPWRARLGAAGAFPSQGPLRVVWVGVEPVAPLAALADAVRAACRETGLAFDERPFAAHLTLARCRPAWPAAQRDRIAALVPAPGIAFEIAGVTVLESELGPGGPRYRPRAALALGAAA